MSKTPDYILAIREENERNGLRQAIENQTCDEGCHFGDHDEHTSTQPAPETGGEWRVEAMPTHGWWVVDAAGQEIVADVYRKEDAVQIVREHNSLPLLVAALKEVADSLALNRQEYAARGVHYSEQQWQMREPKWAKSVRVALAAMSREEERE